MLFIVDSAGRVKPSSRDRFSLQQGLRHGHICGIKSRATNIRATNNSGLSDIVWLNNVSSIKPDKSTWQVNLYNISKEVQRLPDNQKLPCSKAGVTDERRSSTQGILTRTQPELWIYKAVLHCGVRTLCQGFHTRQIPPPLGDSKYILIYQS